MATYRLKDADLTISFIFKLTSTSDRRSLHDNGQLYFICKLLYVLQQLLFTNAHTAACTRSRERYRNQVPRGAHDIENDRGGASRYGREYISRRENHRSAMIHRSLRAAWTARGDTPGVRGRGTTRSTMSRRYLSILSRDTFYVTPRYHPPAIL